MSDILRGKPVAEKIKKEIILKTIKCRLEDIDPKIAIVRVGERPDDIAYEKRVMQNCVSAGLRYDLYEFPADISQEEFEKEFSKINNYDDIYGILLFRPLPKHLDEKKICEMIDINKDIDCINPDNLSNAFLGNSEGFAPCTPEAVVEILKYYDIPLEGADVVIVNRSMVLGKPLAMLLMSENATVTVCHSKTKNLSEKIRNADIVVTGVGKANNFNENDFSEKNTVIDVGINFENGRMQGDVEFEKVEPVVKAISPVPGGVGTVTSMILLKHAVDSAWRRVNG